MVVFIMIVIIVLFAKNVVSAIKTIKTQRIDILFRMDIGENFIYLKTDTSKRSLWLLFFVSMLFLQTINIR